MAASTVFFTVFCSAASKSFTAWMFPLSRRLEIGIYTTLRIAAFSSLFCGVVGC